MKPAEWNETCSLAPANHEAGPEQQSETDLLRARVAQLEEALREQLGYTPGGPCQLPLIPKCICEKCKNDRARAALSGSSAEWLEEQRRAAQIEVLEKLPCECSYEFKGETKAMSPAELELNTVLVYQCQSCKALAALKGGRG